jgi:hypothetical protein
MQSIGQAIGMFSKLNSKCTTYSIFAKSFKINLD